MKSIKITVFGIVQGVGFRMFILNEAKKIGVKGYVKNNVDGTVEIVAQGNEEQINLITQAARKGPLHSKVDKCEIEDYDTLKIYNDFKVTA
jgi:acylphosphatase